MAAHSGSDRGGVRPAQTARELAQRVLVRVCDKGAFASRALDAELSRSRLNERDAALATEIVYGTLRVLPALDAAYGAFLRKPPEALDELTRAVLRSASYQLLHLSRVPPHAVVDESVTLLRTQRGQSLAGLANAVLRRVAAQRPAEPAPPARLIAPPWVRAAIEPSLGPERTEALLSARALPPPLGLRVRLGLDRDALHAELTNERPDARIELGALSERCLLAQRLGDVRKLPAYARGAITVQEEGSQLIARALGVEAGERIADLCAGHGGKTTFFAERVGDTGSVLAVDLDERKLERIAPELERLGLPQARVETRAIDLSAGAGGLQAKFDRVLIDAACSGLGTLHRRPDLLLRLGPEDPARLAELQLAMLRNAAKLVRAGGVLLYAVCSPAHVEAAHVLERFEREVEGFERAWLTLPELPELTPDRDGVVRIGPFWGASEPASRESPDAYQLARFRRK
jgi:16S rRNA (cytosine967-C5)-methyltransferase